MRRFLKTSLLFCICMGFIDPRFCLTTQSDGDKQCVNQNTRNTSNVKSLRFDFIKQLTEYDFSVDVLGRDVLYRSIVCVVNSMSRDASILDHYNVVASRFLGFEPPIRFFWIESKPQENKWILRQFNIEAVPEFFHVPPSTWGTRKFRVGLSKRFNDGIHGNVEWTAERFVQELTEFVRRSSLHNAPQIYFTWLQCLTAFVTCIVLLFVIVTFLRAYRRNRERTLLACALGVYIFSISCWIHSHVSCVPWFRGTHAKAVRGVSSFAEGIAFAASIFAGALALYYDDYGYYSLLLLPLTFGIFCMHREGHLTPMSATRARLGALFFKWL